MRGLLPALLGMLLLSGTAWGEDSPKSLFDTPSTDEAAYLAKSGGDAERDGARLTLWLKGYGKHERGLVFRDRDPDGDGNSFRFAGRIDDASGDALGYLVKENFAHDAPSIYLIEPSGQEHEFHAGEQSPYLTPSHRHLVSIGDTEIAAANGATQPVLFQILGVHIVSALNLGYRDELTCKVYQPHPDLVAKPLAIGDDAIRLDISSGQQKLGALDLKRDDWRWTMTAPPAILSLLTCAAPRDTP